MNTKVNLLKTTIREEIKRQLTKSDNFITEEILKPGTKVKLRGGKTGKVVRYDGKTPGSPFYIVDIGQYYSIEVPAHEIRTDESVNDYKKQLTEIDGVDTTDLKNLPFQKLVRMIKTDWKNVNYAAKPYLSAMSTMNSADDKYGADSGKSIILYFLANASQWRGPVAKAVKAELNRRIK